MYIGFSFSILFFFVLYIISADTNGRISKSGGTDESANGYVQMNVVNLQGSAPAISDVNEKIPGQFMTLRHPDRPVGAFNAWLSHDNSAKLSHNLGTNAVKKIPPPPRILEALPSYPIDSSESRMST